MGIELLKTHTALTSLDLAGAAVTDAGLARLKIFPGLRSQCLRSVQLTDEGWPISRSSSLGPCIWTGHR